VRVSPAPTIVLKDLAAFLFDMDGVLTRTTDLHIRSWKRVFDEFFAARGGTDRPFTVEDYRQYVDGRPRRDGIRSFLATRGITLTEDNDNEPARSDTVAGLDAEKERFFREELKESGVEIYPGTVEAVRAVRRAGLKTAVVSASRHAAELLETAGIADLFDARVDGNEIIRLGIPGKPDPAMFLEGARRVGVRPERSVVVEDAASGVEAGRAGGFKLVIGVNRDGPPGRLKEAGADIEVGDLSEIELR
jgi:beta-phosphoglucomutase family hydrolase